MDRVYLQWTVVNWITVLLMVSLGYLLIGLVGKGLARMKGMDT